MASVSILTGIDGVHLEMPGVPVFFVRALSDPGHSKLPSHLKEVADVPIFFFYRKGLEPGPRWETEGKSRWKHLVDQLRSRAGVYPEMSPSP